MLKKYESEGRRKKEKMKGYMEKLKRGIRVMGVTIFFFGAPIAFAEEGADANAKLSEELQAQDAARVAEQIPASGELGSEPDEKGKSRIQAETEKSIYEALASENEKKIEVIAKNGEEKVVAKALELKLSEELWKSSEEISKDESSRFIRDKIDLFKEKDADKFYLAKEDYIDDFKEQNGKISNHNAAEEILEDREEAKIEKIALVSERGERKNVEKGEARGSDDVKEAKAEAREEKQADKEERKAEKQAEKEERKAEKQADKDAGKSDEDSGSKGGGDKGK